MSIVGIQATKEVFIGINDLILILVNTFKDGAQVSDIPLLISSVLADEQVKQMLTNLFTKIKDISAEFKDIDSNEIIELVVLETMLVPKIIEALKK